MIITRRQMLKSLLASAGLCLTGLGRHGWALAAEAPQTQRMVFILMRGAVDGLSIVTPYKENYYYNARPNIALAAPGYSGGLTDLDGTFGLHPSLASMLPLWQNRTLAFIQASGSPAETRSHFEAQDIMETALLNSALARQGWMNSLTQALPDNHAPTRALSVGNVLPKIFQGTANISSMPTAIRPNGGGPVENPQLEDEFGKLYQSNGALNGLYKQAVTARAEMMQDLQSEMESAGQGAPVGDAFTQQSIKVGDMMRNDPRIQLVFMDAGGWDTHVGQGNDKGQLANKLEKFGQGLVALAQGLGPAYQNTVILVMSEFGRTVAENGNKGTDHGHGNVAWMFGGGVSGGKVYSRWPGLNPQQLWEGRDLAVTTDFRSIIGTVAANHFGLAEDTVGRIIPNYKADPLIQNIV